VEDNFSFGLKFIDPREVLEQLDISEGIKVADFGCGAGYFSLALAKKIGEEGVVYALDILPQRLEAVNSSAKNLNLTNIITQRANLENTNGSELGENSMDLVVVKDMLFQNKKKKDILNEAKRVLKDGGQALVVEWRVENSTLGPERQLRISKEALLEIAQQIGFSILKELSVGSFHFGVLLVK
jgi:ubiquinone/menaquinone biosynthesis C-methylase UbiE